MATLTLPEERYAELFGPTPAYTPAGGWDNREPDRLVKTHWCFCGVQCGIQLKVKDNKVIGFEPWEEFPVNQGKLCPKGVKRYLQNGHPDRLLSPLIRTGTGFRHAGWDEALNNTVEAIRAIQSKYGKDSFAFLGGASMTNEKAYLNGKFARIALGTANIDYNGRLCMVSAGAANRLAFGVDRAANPWSDIPLARALLIAGSNIAECFPILTDYVWRARAQHCEGSGDLGTGRDFNAAPRSRHRASHEGRRECSQLHQSCTGDGPHRQARLRLRHHHRPGQRSRRSRARPALQPTPRRARHQQPRTSPVHCRFLGRPRKRSAETGFERVRDFRRDRTRRDQRVDVDQLQPAGLDSGRPPHAGAAGGSRVVRADGFG